MKFYKQIDLDKLDIETCRKYNNKQERTISYCNIECGFDIETTSFMSEDTGKESMMYVWGFGIGSELVYGRTWEEFYDLCLTLSNKLELSETKILTCYVHNLGYEFQFMRKLFDEECGWSDIFSLEERKPIKALSKIGIEFKCSYILSGYGLDALAKNLTKHKIEKLTGSLDYSKIRHHETQLTQEEMMYLENDVLIVQYYIKEQMDMYGNISNIPLTNTSRVREYVRNNCYYNNKSHKKSSKGKYLRYRELMEELVLTQKQYELLKRCFMGGFTHASALYSNVMLDDVTSIDYNSSYPAVMLSEKFPMSRPQPVDVKKESFKQLLVDESVGLMFDVKFTGLRSKILYESYLSESKCWDSENILSNNGRVFSADMICTSITNVDFKIMQEVYDWDTITVSNVYKFYMQYLPKPIIKSVLELYEKKTTLKGVEGKETEYLVSKGMLNSIYGMCVTDIIRDEAIYQEHSWTTTQPDNIEGVITTHNNSRNRFLYYPWGVWITAYARKNLWEGILNVGEEDYVYSDTDSIKLLNYEKHKEYINYYNKKLETKLKKMCDFRRVDFNLTRCMTNKGHVKPIGVWEYEGTSTHFKTLGAKRYLTYENGEYVLTVAGLSKQNGMDYICTNNETPSQVFNAFTDELYIPAESTGKMTHTYIDDVYSGVVTDYLGKTAQVTSKSGIHLEPAEFTLSISKHYSMFLKNLRQGYLYTGLKAI